ncbi:uncharacterized protein DUF4349 [Diaminobutyricimonas aerilata]|uniref:Uncharacterized protein DUF4349 n=2 Tax=Diaminobutyricimonas aerilata TaxID=1162967 RepID=A0A2M9CLT6_9MICO|nr:uncharacterized protein DUF4349 [Diaminobutyricimonas aerilata]
MTVIALGAVLALGGCGAMGASDSGGSTAEQAPAAPAPIPGAVDDAEGAAGGGTIPYAEATDPDAGRQVVRSGTMTLTADDPAAAASEAAALAIGAGGRVDSRSLVAGDDDSSARASLVLRVPAEELDAVIDDLDALGDVRNVSTSATDVTTQTQDLDARITALRASVDRLLALLVQADDTDVLLQLETAISERQGELEGLEAQRRSLADQVAMSSLAVEIAAPDAVPADEPGTFLDGLNVGWGSLVAFFSGVLVAFGAALPWLALLASLAAVVALIVRRATRRGRPRNTVEDVGTGAQH